MFCPDLGRLSLAPTGAPKARAPGVAFPELKLDDEDFVEKMKHKRFPAIQSLQPLEAFADRLMSIVRTPNSSTLKVEAKKLLDELEGELVKRFAGQAAAYTASDRVQTLLRVDAVVVTDYARVIDQIEHTLRILNGLGALKTAEGYVLVGAEGYVEPSSLADVVPASDVDQQVVEAMADFEATLVRVAKDWYRKLDTEANQWNAQLESLVESAETREELNAAITRLNQLYEEEAPLTERLRRAFDAKHDALLQCCSRDALEVLHADGVKALQNAHEARVEALLEASVELEDKMQYPAPSDSDDEDKRIAAFQGRARKQRAGY